ncbi:DEAD/DEAH box helicase [Polymorphobacter sp.]|uniref:DEAD/DEAH box helicase n=1 Tax=Polymorphobacter sp. TaxID=1909290 RepID=UPI003F720228
MAFRELVYQERALKSLDAWLGLLAEEKASFDEIAKLKATKPGLPIQHHDFPAEAWKRMGKLPAGKDGPREFSPRLSGDGLPVPNVTLKVPTGGGKTYLACAALARIFGRFMNANNGMVLWIVPNEAIYSQTLKALRNRDHLYRQTLDRVSANRTIIMEKTDPLHARDLEANLCVIVLMLQSSNRENKEALRLFRDRGDVHGFVPPDGDQLAHAQQKAVIPNLDIYDLADGGPPWPMVKASMGNAMRIVRPVVIMDEGQKAVSDLAYATLYGFNPSLVLELTATPRDVKPRPGKPGRIANVLVEITGRELEREGMIKMPMNVLPVDSSDWRDTLRLAWERLEELEATARRLEGEGGPYIRPILLVQVERTGAEQRDSGYIHAEDARAWLKSAAGLDDAEIAVKTAEVNDLDKPENRDLLSPRCQVRAIITKAALAEGWDCPFAYVLCALAANGNESAMTQLVGRILRQPHAAKTDVTPLDECYVYAHRADTKATVEAIKKGLEGDGLGDLSQDVTLPGTSTPGDGVPRNLPRRAEFQPLNIALPQVLVTDDLGRERPLDAETDLFPLVDWSRLDLDALADAIPRNAEAGKMQMIRLRAGDKGVETDDAETFAMEARFDATYAVRIIADLVPNSFAAWDVVAGLVAKLKARGWDDVLLGKLGTLVVDRLRAALTREREAQAEALFKAGLAAGSIHFRLRGDGGDWLAPEHILTSQPITAPDLRGATGKALAHSLFLPIYRADLNDAEQCFAVYLDDASAVRWWHRNGTARGSYAVRGWRRGNVYPDFLIGALRDATQRKRIVVIETKGEQLEGNLDTVYKRELLDTLTTTMAAKRPAKGPGADFEFAAAVVLFQDLDARFPSIIGGDGAA